MSNSTLLTRKLVTYTILLCGLMMGIKGWGQIGTYTFTNSTSTYSALASATIIAATNSSTDDGITAAITIPFTFTYGASSFSTCKMNTNGWMQLGASSTTTGGYSVLSNTVPDNNVIAGFNRDLNLATMSYITTGTSPNRIFKLQWSGFKSYTSSYEPASGTFQIWLYETSNVVEIHYGAFTIRGTSTTATTAQAGLRGTSSSATDIAAVSSLTSWANPTLSTSNASTLPVSSTILPDNGRTYTFSPNSCSAPTTPTISSITTTGATFSWTASVSSPSSYEVYYSTSSTAPTGSTTPNITGITGTSTAITGLTSGTTYYIWVRSSCSSSSKSGWVGTSFTTTCGNISSFPWTENFDALTSVGAGIFPSCWSSQTGSSAFTTKNTSDGYHSYYSASNYVDIYYGTSASYLWAPSMTLTAGTTYNFSFYWAGDGYTGWTGNALINTSASSSGATTLGTFVSTGTTTSTSYTQVTYSFTPTATGTYYFGISVLSNSTPYYLGFDNFAVAVATCAPPTALTASSVGNTTATLSWTAPTSAPSSGYDIYYTTSSTAPNASTTPTTTSTTTSKSLTGLTSGTTYYAYVRSNCGSSTSAWTAATIFTTTCSIVSTFPWSENFDGLTTLGAGVLPTCWSTQTGSSAFTTKNTSDGYHSYYSASNYVDIYYGTTASYLWTIPFSLTAGTTYSFNFYWAGDGYTGWTGNALVNTTNSSIGAITLGNFVSSSVTTSTSYTQATYTFTPSTTNTYYFGVSVLSNLTPFYLGFDNFNVSALPACAIPLVPGGLSLGASATTSQAGTITAPATPATGFLVLSSTSSTLSSNPVNGTTYSVGGSLGGGTVQYVGTGTSFTASTSLSSNTKYNYFVYSYNSGCAGAPYYSTTSATNNKYTCITAPTGLTAGSVSTSSASISWTAPNGAITSYDLKYGTTSGVYSTTVTGVTSPYSLTGLTAGTTYYYVIVANNTANTSSCGTSTTSAEANFTTTCAPVLIPYTQGFNSSTIPNCWSTAIVSTQTGTKISFPTSGTSPTTSPYEGSNMVLYNSFSNTNGGAGSEERLVSAPLATTGSSSVDVQFYWRNENNTTYSTGAYLNEGVQIQYSFDKTTWTNVTGGFFARHDATLTAGTAAWKQKTITLPAAAGNVSTLYIGFKFHSEYGDNMFMDYVDIHTTPTCSVPTALTASSITTTTATVSWTAPATGSPVGYNWEVRTSGVGGSGPTGLTASGSTTAPTTTANVTGLTASTTYYLYVQTNCGASSTSSWAGPYTFITLCGAVSVPYTQNFDGVTAPAIPSCTSVQDVNADGYTWKTSTTYYNSSPNSLQYSYNTSSAANDWWFTPGINMTAGTTYQISFAYRAYSSSFPEGLEVKTGATASAAGMTSAALFSNTSITNTSFITTTFTYTATTTGIQYFGWHEISAANEFNLYIDDISITVLPPCSGTPTGGTVAVTPSSGAPASSYTVSATGYSTNSGLTYQWQSSTDGGITWANVGSSTTTYSALSQTAGAFGTVTTYRLVVTCTNSGLSANSSTATFTSTYCTPTHTYADAENMITRVDFVGTLNDVSNTSGTNTNAYEDFTGLPNIAKQEQGAAINLNVFANTASTLWNAWVDWNKNGVFDATEQVYNSNDFFTLTTTFGFQIPANQSVGNYRIRIRTADYSTGSGGVDGYSNSSIGACGNLLDGQTEDYLFTVIASCNAQVVAFSDDTKCSSAAISFSLSATGTATTTSFKWYSAQTGGTLIATTPASGNPPVSTFTTGALGTSVTYWVTASNGTCESSFRVPVTADKRPVPTISFTPSSPARICNGDNLSVGGASSTETADLINEGFESGSTSEFTITNKGTLTDATNQPWKIRTSIFTPTMSSVWKPAVSSGFGSNKFIFALSDIANSGVYRTSLTSNPHSTTGFTYLKLSYKLYFDHYLPDGNNSILDTVTVFASPDNGTTWNNIKTYITDQGEASKMASDTISLSSAYLNQSSVKVRFTYSAKWTNGVALDSIRLFGDRPASNSYVWTQVGGLIDNCLYTDPGFTTPYVTGTPTSQVYLKPTNDQQEDGTPLEFETQLTASNGCIVKDTLVVNIDDKIWTGVNGINWNTGSNWCGNQPPKLSDRVSVPYLVSGIYPVIPINVVGKTRFLTIDSGASLTIDSGASLQIRRDLFTQVGGSFINNGTLELSGKNINIDNKEPQNFPGPGNVAVMNNLIINDSTQSPNGGYHVLLDAAVSIRGKLTDSVGLLALGDNDITIKSSSVSTGSIGMFTNNSAGFAHNGTGRFVIERFIPARRAWRFLTPPLDNASSVQTINAAWQEGKTNPDLNCVNNQVGTPGFGTEITYNNTNGYDPNITYNTSIKAWVNNAWATPTGTNIPLNTYSAYCLFVRGDRTICLSQGTSATPNSTVLRVRGKLNEPGTSSLNFSKAYPGNPGDFILIGNPYASSIDLTNVLKSSRSNGIDFNKFWAWSPRANGAYGVGGYIAFSNGIQVPKTSNPSDTDVNYKGGTIMQSGQAFMVQLSSLSSSANMNFQQSDKTSTQTVNVFGKQSQPLSPVIYTNLLIPENDKLSLTDGVGAAFGKKFADSVDGTDAAKQWNFDENIALFRDNKYLAIEFRSQSKLTDTLFYKLYLRMQPYKLQIFTQDFAGMPLMRAWLIDKYLNTKTEVNLSDTTFYDFAPVYQSDGVTPDTNSYRNRFMLVFNRQISTNPIPVTQVQNQGDPNITGIAIGAGSGNSNIIIIPNPVTTAKNAKLIFSNMPAGEYEIIIYSGKGDKLATKKVQHSGVKTPYNLPSGLTFASGVYNVIVINANGEQVSSEKLIISR